MNPFDLPSLAPLWLQITLAVVIAAAVVWVVRHS